MKWRRRPPSKNPATDTADQDQRVARLTAKADLIVEELDHVVREMAVMLRDAYGLKND